MRSMFPYSYYYLFHDAGFVPLVILSFILWCQIWYLIHIIIYYYYLTSDAFEMKPRHCDVKVSVARLILVQYNA